MLEFKLAVLLHKSKSFWIKGLDGFKKKKCCVIVPNRAKETSVSHPQGDGVGTDGLSSLSGLPWRSR